MAQFIQGKLTGFCRKLEGEERVWQFPNSFHPPILQNFLWHSQVFNAHLIQSHLPCKVPHNRQVGAGSRCLAASSLPGSPWVLPASHCAREGSAADYFHCKLVRFPVVGFTCKMPLTVALDVYFACQSSPCPSKSAFGFLTCSLPRALAVFSWQEGMNEKADFILKN